MKSLIGEIPIVLPSEGVVEYVAFRVSRFIARGIHHSSPCIASFRMHRPSISFRNVESSDL